MERPEIGPQKVSVYATFSTTSADLTVPAITQEIGLSSRTQPAGMDRKPCLQVNFMIQNTYTNSPNSQCPQHQCSILCRSATSTNLSETAKLTAPNIPRTKVVFPN
uniref:Uncharacterized protein n=1 Tax=Anopheles melas TaxID=34690 RepID=A0A182U7R6_9DIPT